MERMRKREAREHVYKWMRARRLACSNSNTYGRTCRRTRTNTPAHVHTHTVMHTQAHTQTHEIQTHARALTHTCILINKHTRETVENTGSLVPL